MFGAPAHQQSPGVIEASVKQRTVRTRQIPTLAIAMAPFNRIRG